MSSSVGLAGMTEDSMNVLGKQGFQTHIAILGWLRIAYSALLMLTGAFVGTLLIGIGAATRDATANEVIGLTGAAVGGLLVILSLPGLAAGSAPAPRPGPVMALVLSAFDLIAFPIGTVLGAYTVFVLSQQAAVEAFGTCCSIEESRLQAVSA
jgi:hypothetical protein